ncbi:Las1-like [Phytophthora infestans]|uniref:Las1-like n=1 Tax=Phytophthora infestans TaxID=4787 RepID=A0A8S9TP27_PHYIN|nr:Las1-like [Phytophthora infestans]
MSGRMNGVPWLDWSEWQEVHVGLFSTDPFVQQRAVSRVASWRSRVQLPVAVNATAQLVELLLHESMAQHHHHAVGVSSRSHMELSLLYASVIVRCVNGLVDGSQKGAYATAVSTLAHRIGIPLWVVDLRHESSHNQLPSLPVLRFAAQHLLAWLRANYWGAQEDLIRGQVHQVAQWLFEQLPHLSNAEEMQVDSTQGAPMPLLDADNLRNIVIPLLVAGEQYSERIAPAGLLFLGAPSLAETQDAEIFQKETFITLLLQLQPLWRGLSASLLARLCRKVFDTIRPPKTRRQSEDGDDESINIDTLQQNEVDLALQWIKFMASSEYRERIKLQIGPIEDLCRCGAEMLVLAEKLKADEAAGEHTELLERFLTTLKSSKAIRNHSTLATEAANATSVATASGWTQLSAWVESPLGLRHCYTSYNSSNQQQVCEYSLDDDMLMPDSTTFVAPDEDEEDSTKADAEKTIDALMEDLDAAYDTALQHNIELQTTITRDGLRQGSSTTVLPKQELQRIQGEIEIW